MAPSPDSDRYLSQDTDEGFFALGDRYPAHLVSPPLPILNPSNT